jgi:hypothetical protein
MKDRLSVRQIGDLAFIVGATGFDGENGSQARELAVTSAIILAEQHERPLSRCVARLLCLFDAVDPEPGCRCDRCPAPGYSARLVAVARRMEA